MSFEHGLMAMKLQMPPRVPRTEYSIEGHWDVVRAVTGIGVTEHSPDEQRWRASLEFKKAWNYDFIWCTIIASGELKARRTNMGHAVYAAGGADYDTNITAGFLSPDEVFALDMEATYPR